jgi:2'-5' RNA ligase
LGASLAGQRLHITLQGLGNFRDALPQANVDAVMVAAATVDCPPIEIVFDRVLSFLHNDACVLRCDAGSDAAVARLRQMLALALSRVGLRPAPSRAPHMTMRYDPRHIVEQATLPIRWTASDFALILSHAGLTHQQWLARWPLIMRSRTPLRDKLMRLRSR